MMRQTKAIFSIYSSDDSMSRIAVFGDTISECWAQIASIANRQTTMITKIELFGRPYVVGIREDD